MQPLTLTFSTDAVYPRDRFDFWHFAARKSAAALLRLTALCQRGMRCADIATAAGMRNANRLLLQQGNSLERFLQHRRLERCREALRNPGHGLAPRDYRREG